MNVLLAITQGAATQREELEAERAQLVKQLVKVAHDLAVLEVHELLATETAVTNGKVAAAPERPEVAGNR